jgi:hypothetical protein
MDTLIFLAGVTAIIAANSLTAFVSGWLLTEVVMLPLNFKPFNCRPCLTFWLTVLFDFILALTAAPHFMRRGLVSDRLTLIYGIAGIGVLAGFINFLYLKLKFRIYD